QGYALQLKPKFRGVMEKLYGGVREARLSTQAIDVLALVAYRQPATKMEIDSLRGGESGALLRQLVRRGLIQIAYRAEAERKEVSYGTTQRFWTCLGCKAWTICRKRRNWNCNQFEREGVDLDYMTAPTYDLSINFRRSPQLTFGQVIAST